MAFRKNKPESLFMNPLTGGPVRSAAPRIRANPLSIYNRSNPFSPIQEESGEENSRGSANNSSKAPSPPDATFTRTPGSTLPSTIRKHYDWSSPFSTPNSSVRRFSFDRSTQTPDRNQSMHDSSTTSGFHSGREDVSAFRCTVATNTEPDLNQAFIILPHDTTNAVMDSNRDKQPLDDKCLQTLSELLLEHPTDDPDAIPEHETKQLHGVINLRNFRVNVNVRVSYRNAEQSKIDLIPDVSVNNLRLPQPDFTPNSSKHLRAIIRKVYFNQLYFDFWFLKTASTPSKSMPTSARHISTASQTNLSLKDGNLESTQQVQQKPPPLPLPPPIKDAETNTTTEMATADVPMSLCESIDESLCSFALSDLTYVKRNCSSLTDLELGQVNRLSAITVAVRVRPFSRAELLTGNKSTLLRVDHERSLVELFDKQDCSKVKYAFKFDYCFGEPYFLSTSEDEQLKIYERIGRPYIENVFRGYNLCYFAYGQTGTGKSYTIMGDQSHPGLITRFARDLFTIIDWYRLKRAALQKQQPSLVRNLTFTKEHGQFFGQHFVSSSPLTNTKCTGGLDEPDRRTTSTQSDNAAYEILNQTQLEQLFSLADRDYELQISLQISYYEIYNERIYDLLDESGQTKCTSKVREHPTRGPYIEGLTTKLVHSIDQLLYFYNLGTKRRCTSSNPTNDHSSRSHAIFSINCTQDKVQHMMTTSMMMTTSSSSGTATESGSVKSVEQIRSKINFVDLAGSERSHATSTDRHKESNSINRSLLTLGQVITKLSNQPNRSNRSASVPCLPGCASLQGSIGSDSAASLCRSCTSDVTWYTNPGFIPYRDSVLTWLLKDCLGGNSKTVMLATISPHLNYYEQTLCTLRYAQKATKIMNHVRANHSFLASTSRHPHLIHPDVFNQTNREPTSNEHLVPTATTAAHQTSPSADVIHRAVPIESMNLVDRIRLLFADILSSS